MNNINTEWFWNSSTNNHLALPAPNSLSMQRASSVSTNAILTDVGICVGMRNVNLNRESACFIKNLPHCCKYSIPRPLIPPNWYNNYTQYLCRNEALTKYHETIRLSNELNALVGNEYSSANIGDGMLKFGHNMSSTHSVSHTEDFNLTRDEEPSPITSNVTPIIKDEFLDPSLAPPKKKWIRHYMMGE